MSILWSSEALLLGCSSCYTVLMTHDVVFKTTLFLVCNWLLVTILSATRVQPSIRLSVSPRPSARVCGINVLVRLKRASQLAFLRPSKIWCETISREGDVSVDWSSAVTKSVTLGFMHNLLCPYIALSGWVCFVTDDLSRICVFSCTHPRYIFDCLLRC